jgi:sulfhydrogenase subunit alpha
MHTIDLTMDRISKIEGAASLDVKVVDDKVTECRFATTEYKRFYVEAMKGKPIIALPQLLSRICGTCSNAHLLASIAACEDALGIVPSEQTMLLRWLTTYGLNIRDHALHLYLFVMPDLYGKDAFLDFDENDPEQHQQLHDGFEIKAAGNFLAALVAGRSVHALHPTIGGFLHFPDAEGLTEAVTKLEAIRPAVLRLIDTFAKQPFHLDRKTHYMALVPERYGFLTGSIYRTDTGETIPPREFRQHLEHVVLPYSQASAYTHKKSAYMVGSLARLNIAKDKLHAKTRETLGALLDRFPSTDIFDNNLAQAIEILHCVDDALEILKTSTFKPESVIKKPYKASVGIGVIEAPRGTLYHKVEIDDKGIVLGGEVIVPTNQNQINIEEDVAVLVEKLIADTDKDKLEFEIEKLIRAYDPCMSCAAHFLKVKWDKQTQPH